MDRDELEKCRKDAGRFWTHYCYPGKLGEQPTKITIELTQTEVFRLLRWRELRCILMKVSSHIKFVHINDVVTKKAADTFVLSMIDDLEHRRGPR